MRRGSAFACFGLLLVLPLAGCGGGVARERLTDVEAVVFLDGSPVEGATVTLVPVSEGTASSATGTTDASGRARLLALIPGKPVQGEYYVGVVKSEVVEDSGGSGGRTRSSAQAPPEAKVRHLVPAKFNSPQQSGIKVNISPGQKEVKIELSSR